MDWVVGDRVAAAVETDHPEDPIGEVVMITADGGIVVNFPQAGAEIYGPDELVAAPANGDEPGSN
ncbi:hypothetical protein [Streptomyces sp. NPDC052114]|uniref:hypothetical protein n=1 Tax=Streptomyces sp. NPDC052114 TaxID=3155528 RepID=UPI00342908AD